MQYLGTILFKILQPKDLKEEISESHMIVHYSRTWIAGQPLFACKDTPICTQLWVMVSRR